MTLIGPREPVSSSRHPSSPKRKSSAQLFSIHSTRLFDSAVAQPFWNVSLPSFIAPSLTPPPLPPSIYPSKLIFFVMPLFFRPPFAIVKFVDVHSAWLYLSTNVFHPISISTSGTEPRFLSCTVRMEYANRFKSNYPTEKEPARLSVPSDLIGIIIFYSTNPLFPRCSRDFSVCLTNKPV